MQFRQRLPSVSSLSAQCKAYAFKNVRFSLLVRRSYLDAQTAKGAHETKVMDDGETLTGDH